ncbi:MAG: non-canonical purine NTP diphosphatase [Flavobacterium sp.]
MKLIFATHNQNKVIEIAPLIPQHFEIVSLHDIGFLEDIPETAFTLEGNAVLKAETIFKATGLNCFADDTGLEVEALNGAPGVFSARYAGEQKNAQVNINKLLHELQEEQNRKARFRTVICLILEGEKYMFEGIVEGKIETVRAGSGGFGYDPIFTPKGYQQTFAQMTLEEKSKISHRGIAFDQLIRFLNEYKS